MKAYHFTGDKLRDGRAIPPIGAWLIHEGAISPCESGLHASKTPFDALTYAPGPIIHLVELCGEIQTHGEPLDKIVGRKRKIIASFDSTEICRYAARMYALEVAHLWGAPDLVLEYLFTGDDNLRDAAWDAAWDAARAAARAAALKRNAKLFNDMIYSEFNSILT